MKDNPINERVAEFRQRLKKERKKARLTQEKLAAKLDELGYGKGQSGVSEWETNGRLPDLETIFALSRILECDCGYLLGDYEERTRDSADICKATGLSEETINRLCSWATWGVGQEAAMVIDALVSDFGYATKGEKIAPLIYLLNWYLKYNGKQNKGARVDINGKIVDTNDTTGYLGNSINLDSRLIENAALMEIQQGLISLKKRIAREKGRNNGKHHKDD